MKTLREHIERHDILAFAYFDPQKNLIAYGEVLKKKTSCSLCRIIVNPSHRGRGYGKSFCTELVKWIKSNTEAEAITLNTLCENSRAKRCYQKVGFKEISSGTKGRLLLGKISRVIVMKMLL